MVTSMGRRPWHARWRRRANWMISSIALVWPCSAPWNGRSRTACARWLLSSELQAAEEEDEEEGEVVPALGAWLPLAAHWLQDCSLACVLL